MNNHFDPLHALVKEKSHIRLTLMTSIMFVRPRPIPKILKKSAAHGTQFFEIEGISKSFFISIISDRNNVYKLIKKI